MEGLYESIVQIFASCGVGKYDQLPISKAEIVAKKINERFGLTLIKADIELKSPMHIETIIYRNYRKLKIYL